MTNRNVKEIFNVKMVNYLISCGNHVIEIRQNLKRDKQAKLVFVFENTLKLNEDMHNYTLKLKERR